MDWSLIETSNKTESLLSTGSSLSGGKNNNLLANRWKWFFSHEKQSTYFDSSYKFVKILFFKNIFKLGVWKVSSEWNIHFRLETENSNFYKFFSDSLLKYGKHLFCDIVDVLCLKLPHLQTILMANKWTNYSFSSTWLLLFSWRSDAKGLFIFTR